MTIDEAIARERNLTEIYRNNIVPKEDYHNMPWIDMENELNMRSGEEHEQLAEWLQELKQLREQTTWIPCSERLPEEAFGCLVTVMDCEPSTQTDFENILPYFVGYDGETWNDADGNVIPFEVIAWQPLPEPYKESD